MEIFIEKQLLNLLYSIILGLIFGAIYDIIKIVHVSCGIASYTGESRGMKKGVVPFLLFLLTDIFYIFPVSCIFSVFLYAVNKGGFRFYLLAGVIGGMFLYQNTFGRLVMFVSEAIVRFLKRLFTLLLIRPIRYVLGQILKAFVFLGRHTSGKLLSLFKRLTAVTYTEYTRKKLEDAVRLYADDGKGRDH